MISIATFNIHNFCDSEQIDSTDVLKEIFQHNKFDIIGLQEVDNVDKLQSIVGDYNYVYNRHNAILSKYPMENILEQKTKERYVSVMITLPTNKKLCITNIHLNYKSEIVRMLELDKILPDELSPKEALELIYKLKDIKK